MADTDSSQPPPENSNSKSSPPSPTTPLQEQRVMTNSGAQNPEKNTDSAKQLAQDVHWITHATFWSQVGLGVIGIVALWIYHAQLVALIESNRINRESLESVQRAFVIFDAIQANLASRINGPKTIEPVILFSSLWENTGITPAVGIAQGFEVDELDAEPTAERFYNLTLGAGSL